METVKPFVKWAGGKGNLISQLTKYYPLELKDGIIEKYVEPFVGGGAVLIDILQKYNVKEAYALDTNSDLINGYNVVKEDVESLIQQLDKMEKEYISLDTEERKKYYYKVRKTYNSYKLKEELKIKRAAEFIFLNKTCFNGLYRVNKSGEFNVPCGKYKNPTICDAKNLRNLSKLIQNVMFKCEDYTKSNEYIDGATFVYFDPPYRPLSDTSAFTSYTKENFNDKNQEELAEYFRKLDMKNAKLMLSNSNPKNINENDNFFEEKYNGFYINVVTSKRMINSNGKKRGEISELLITNYNENDNCIQQNTYLKMVASN